jgi:hypothetical protein
VLMFEAFTQKWNQILNNDSKGVVKVSQVAGKDLGFCEGSLGCDSYVEVIVNFLVGVLRHYSSVINYYGL